MTRHSLRGALGAFVVALVLPSAFAGTAHAEDVVGAPYVPKPDDDLRRLLDLVRQRSPSLQAEFLNVDIARADARQARLRSNPVVDATWGTIPIGETNPSNLGSPLANVPNYSVGVSYTFPLGKRGPRAERSDAVTEAAGHLAETSARLLALELAHTLGRIAVARLRVDGLRSLAAQQRTVIVLTRARLAQGFGTPLDIDRLEIELSRSEQQVLVTEAEEQAGLTACASYIGTPCRGFASAEEARGLIVAWAKRATEATEHLETRPDIRALDALQRAASAEAELARAQAIPDPTVRVGYMRDQFTVAGNQLNSLNVSISVPLTVFDHGQAQTQAAEARRTRLRDQRALTLRASQTRVDSLRELLRLQQKRQEAIAKTLPRARAVLEDLQRAANGQLIPFTDVIQARRTLDELLIEEADSYSDSFQTSVDLIAETGPSEAR